MLPNNKPICCNQTAKWVDMGPRLQYWYCDKCKNEVPDVWAGPWSTDGSEPAAEPHYLDSLKHAARANNTQTNKPKWALPLQPNEVVITGTHAFCTKDVHAWVTFAEYNKGDACLCGSRFAMLQPQASVSLPSKP